MKVTATDVSFTHEEGMATLGFDQMPPEIQRTYNYDPSVLLDPVVKAKMKKDRDDAVAIIAKSPTRAHVVITMPRADASICSAYLPIMEKTNKRTTTGYIMKEVISKEPTRIMVVDAIGKPKGHDFGIVQLYPCGVDKFYGPMYAMDPGKAYDTLKAAPVKH